MAFEARSSVHQGCGVATQVVTPLLLSLVIDKRAVKVTYEAFRHHRFVILHLGFTQLAELVDDDTKDDIEQQNKYQHEERKVEDVSCDEGDRVGAHRDGVVTKLII